MMKFVSIMQFFVVGFSVVTCGISSVVFLKLVSYVCVNKWCRQKRSEVRKSHRRKSVSMSEPVSMYQCCMSETLFLNI